MLSREFILFFFRFKRNQRNGRFDVFWQVWVHCLHQLNSASVSLLAETRLVGLMRFRRFMSLLWNHGNWGWLYLFKLICMCLQKPILKHHFWIDVPSLKKEIVWMLVLIIEIYCFRQIIVTVFQGHYFFLCLSWWYLSWKWIWPSYCSKCVYSELLGIDN